MDLPDTALIDGVAVAKHLGVSHNTVKRWAQAGVMPKGRRLGPRLLKWSRKEIETWIKEGCPEVNGETK